MEKNLHLDFKPQEEISDTISTTSANFSYFPFDEHSPSLLESLNSFQNDHPNNSKKIRKKRNAYHKIDDDVRLALLEAVQRGETLKSAAKRYQVNYSSAKSIFHIYKKEGRILKKATQDRDFAMFPPDPNAEPLPQFVQNPSQLHQMNPPPMRPYSYQKSIFPQPCYPPQEYRQNNQGPNPNHGGHDENPNLCPSPLDDLMDNFIEMLKIEGNPKPKEDNRPTEPLPPGDETYMPQVAFPMSQPNQAVNKPPQQQPQPQHGPGPNGPNGPNPELSFSSKPPTNQQVSPGEKMRRFDSFYMNYSNSPLSGKRGGGGGMVQEGSESGSNRYFQGEFDSFSEMISAFQTQKHLTESLKDLSVSRYMGETPKAMETQTPKDKVPERKPSGDDDLGWAKYFSDSAADTYKNFAEAQTVLSDAFTKGTWLGHMAHHSKTKVDTSKMDVSPNPRYTSPSPRFSAMSPSPRFMGPSPRYNFFGN